MNKNIKPYNDKNQAHGYWEVYWSNSEAWYKIYWKVYWLGRPWYKAFYHNDNEIGYEESNKSFNSSYITKRYYI